MSDGPPTCPQCSAQLAPTAAQGSLCPRCLLAQGMLHSDSGPPQPPQLPPELAELAPLFPELEILELLGQGGMGAVYKARQRALGRLVALKILVPRAGDEAGFAARFEREAHALARLAHPNVVGIHDSGRTQGRCWLLMEYVEGVNLRQLLRTGELGVPRALAIVRQICDALEFAHEQGIVHRDIKPENVLVDSKGRVKIADFGLAKIVGEEPTGEPITRTQQSMGTPQYMAPEQLTGSKTVDHRADIYSLGVVFYELLTGELPLGRFEPPSQRVQVDVRLDDVVLRALERAPERRYQHATEMKTRIEGLDQPAPAPASVPSLAWLVLFWPAELVLRLVPPALALGPYHEGQILLAFNGLVALVLCVCAFVFRADRRGAALRTAIGATLVVGALATLARESVVFPSLFGLMEAPETPLELWFLRGLLVLVAFEGLRLWLGGRAALRAFGVGGRRSDVWAALGAAAVVAGAMFEATWVWAGVVQCLAVLAVDPPAAPRAVEPATLVRPPRGLRTLLGRVVLPVLVAISAWVMSAYTQDWSWYGVLASSLVLALAVAGYLQQTIAPEVLEELRQESALLRVLRALSALVVLSIGAMGIGAAALGAEPKSPVQAAGPSGDRLRQLTELVAASAHERDDPLRDLPARIQGATLTWDLMDVFPETRIERPRPQPFEAALLVLLAPALLVWTRRYQKSWSGCWRHSLEVLLIVLVGWAGSLPVRAFLPLAAPASGKPLVLASSFPFSREHASANLRSVLELEGYRVQRSELRLYSDREGAVLSYERLRAQGSGSPCPAIECELAGDIGHWGAGVRLEAGDVPERARAGARDLLARLLKQTREH